MKKIVILGSTGSLGTQTLEVLEKYRKDFKIVGLSANKNAELLKKQTKEFNIKKTALVSKEGSKKMLSLIQDADIIVNVLSGIAGITPSIEALKKGKILLLGNKESLVAEGEKIMRIVKKHPHSKTALIPLDSEHNAIYEIFQKFPEEKFEKIILPCSGGPFYGKSKKKLEKITPTQAFSHPRWKMGTKISLESATLINKGLEIIEAHYLFNIPLSKIEVRIHPKCQIHGAVKFKNRRIGIIGYLSKPDMREHIENALLRALDKIPKRKICEIKTPILRTLHPVKKTPLKGIDLVLAAFKKNPKAMKNFLKTEEKTLKKFTEGKIEFPEIFKELK